MAHKVYDTIVEFYHQKNFGPRGLSMREALGGKYFSRVSRLEFPDKETVPLPAPDLTGGGSIISNMNKWRNSPQRLRFSRSTLEGVSGILFHAYGRTEDKGEKRASPSGHSAHALGIYVVINRVKGLRPGLYYYDSLEHQLVLLQRGVLYPGLVTSLVC